MKSVVNTKSKMPHYYFEKGTCAKYQTDEEKKSKGFVNGDCVNASISKFIQLNHKFGDYFDLVCVLGLRNTTSTIRLMDKKEYIENYLQLGKYIIHFEIYNKKLEQYIDTSNNSVIILSKENQYSRFNLENNKVHKIYHFPASYLKKYDMNGLFRFCNTILRKQHTEPFSEEEETKLKSEGVVIINDN